MTAVVSIEEVAEHFRMALRGEVPVRLEDPECTWDEVYCGVVRFWFGDWNVVLYNDCGELDYTAGVTTPDGRTAEFDDWCGIEDTGCPINMLEDDEFASLEQIVSEAK